MRYDATVRNIELIGEAATHIPESVRQAHPDIPWRMVIATRNQLIHGYAGIDDDVLWSIVQTDVPLLLKSLRHLKIQVSGYWVKFIAARHALRATVLQPQGVNQFGRIIALKPPTTRTGRCATTPHP